jgi:hypothetical protein
MKNITEVQFTRGNKVIVKHSEISQFIESFGQQQPVNKSGTSFTDTIDITEESRSTKNIEKVTEQVYNYYQQKGVEVFVKQLKFI